MTVEMVRLGRMGGVERVWALGTATTKGCNSGGIAETGPSVQNLHRQ
jgi:hypothetical protein